MAQDHLPSPAGPGRAGGVPAGHLGGLRRPPGGAVRPAGRTVDRWAGRRARPPAPRASAPSRPRPPVRRTRPRRARCRGGRTVAGGPAPRVGRGRGGARCRGGPRVGARRRGDPSGAGRLPSFVPHAARPAHGPPLVAGWRSPGVAQGRRTSASWPAPLRAARGPPGATMATRHAGAGAPGPRVGQRGVARRPAAGRRPRCVCAAGDEAVQVAPGRRRPDRGPRATMLVRRRSGRGC